MTTNDALYHDALKFIPGGVNSPVRAFKAVGGTPKFISHAKGAHIFDAEGKSYIDYVGSWGPMILGHAHPHVIAAVQHAAEKGLSFGAPTESEITLAKLICTLMPSIEQVRMVSSGTEATMSALRLARGFTGRDKIIKFNGCYHGHSDSLLVKAGSGALTFGTPSSPGVPKSITEHTLTAEFNRLDQVEALFQQFPNDIAAVILEPIAGNMNCVLPTETFLKGLRKLCDEYRSVLIFDEVMTGFRVGLGGAQERYKVTPDLTTLGKVIGGGMPVGAFGGRKEIMQCLSPNGDVYQAGTLSGNPVAMAAGIATLELIQAPNFFETLEKNAARFMTGLQKIANHHNIPLTYHVAGGMFGFFFNEKTTIETFEDVMQSDLQRFNSFFHAMLDAGVYMAPSAFEAGFISSAHTDVDIDKTLQLAETAIKKVGTSSHSTSTTR